MSVSSVTVTKTNMSLSPGQTDFLEAKVNHDDGRTDYNYRVVVSPEGACQVTHSGSQVVIRAGAGGGQALLRVVSNHNPQIATEVKILVAGLQKSDVRGQKSDSGSQVPVSAIRPPTSEFRPPLSDSNSAFIDQLYRDILHRRADAAGKTYWVKMLDKNLYSRDEVREAFQQSR